MNFLNQSFQQKSPVLLDAHGSCPEDCQTFMKQIDEHAKLGTIKEFLESKVDMLQKCKPLCPAPTLLGGWNVGCFFASDPDWCFKQSAPQR